MKVKVSILPKSRRNFPHLRPNSLVPTGALVRVAGTPMVGSVLGGAVVVSNSHVLGARLQAVDLPQLVAGATVCGTGRPIASLPSAGQEEIQI